MKSDIAQHFFKAVAAPEIRQALSCKNADPMLWREKSFDAVIDGQWISGVFDRVTIEHDQNGKVTRATVQDLKSDSIADESSLASRVEFHESQLSSYRRALATILKIDPARVVGEIIFTQPGRVCRV
jgi:ATP-dependent helicase/nuclease subunit A